MTTNARTQTAELSSNLYWQRFKPSLQRFAAGVEGAINDRTTNDRMKENDETQPKPDSGEPDDTGEKGEENGEGDTKLPGGEQETTEEQT